MKKTRTRTLATGQAVAVHRNDGLRKRCDCPRRAWATCPHPWHFAFKWAGVHYRFPIGRPFAWRGQQLRFPAEGSITTRRDAENTADLLRVAIRDGHFPPAPKVTAPTPDALTFEAFTTNWRERARATDPNVGDSTRAQDSAICTRLSNLLISGERFGPRLIGSLTEDDFEAAFGQLTDLAASSWNKYRNAVRMMQAWGVKKSYLPRPWVREDNEVIRHQSEKGDKRERRLLADVIDDKGKLRAPGEEKRLLEKAGPWLQRLIIAALETGCRRGELLSLQWADVDLTRGVLTVRAVNAKSNTSRRVPVSTRLRGVLAMVQTAPDGSTHKPTAFVFGDAIGGQVKDPKKAWATCCKAAGITGLHFHDLRHEAGSRMLEAGWPLSHVQHALGHADAATTSRYLNATTEHLIDSMTRFGMQPLHRLAQSTDLEPPLPVQRDSPAAANVLVN